MNIINYLEQAHETCGGVKLVEWVPKPPTTSRKKKPKALTDELQK